MTASLEAAFRLDGRVALVTGAARGLGADMAEVFATAGAAVMLTDNDSAALEKTAEALASNGHRIAHRALDVTSESDWEAAVKATVDELDGLDILVNNAGIESMAYLTDLELAEFRKMQQVNVDGTFLGLKYGLRAMRPGGDAGKGGSIINMSSAAGLFGVAGLGAYCASKGAVRLLTKAAAMECAHLGHGVRVNSIHPAVVDTTDMGRNFINGFYQLGMVDSEAAAHETVGTLLPLGYGRARDVSHAALYLASDASRWTTGTELVVDGGASAD